MLRSCLKVVLESICIGNCLFKKSFVYEEGEGGGVVV